jgi:hypothetical protein
MLKRIIRYLYHRYCTNPEIKSLYLDGVQRDFNIPHLSEKDSTLRNIATHNYLESGWFHHIFNEHLKGHVESLFNVCETQAHRDAMHDTINSLLKLEQAFKLHGHRPDGKVEFDKYEM